MTTENGARVAEQSGAFHLANLGPARGAVGGDMALLPGAPERAEDRGGAADEAAGAGERARLVEDVRRVGVVAIPPRGIGRDHVCTPVTNAQLVCRLMLEKKTRH